MDNAELARKAAVAMGWEQMYIPPSPNLRTPEGEYHNPDDILTDPRWLGPMLRRINQITGASYTLAADNDGALATVWGRQHVCGSTIREHASRDNADLIAVARALVAAWEEGNATDS